MYLCTKVSNGMQKLGYIVSKRKIKDVEEFVEVVTSIDMVDDPTKPILVVGLNEAKKLTENFSILEKKIEENLYWTFGKTERRVDYDRDINTFYNYVLNKSVSNVQYTYINVLGYCYSRLKKLILFLQSNIDKYIYIYNEMMYIYYGNKVLGISLKMLRYNKISNAKVINLVKRNKNNRIYYSDKCLGLKLKQIISNRRYATPYFLAIFECEK